MSCAERLAQYLRERGVDFEVQQHRTAYTSGEIAATEHIPGKMVAKTVMGFADGKMVMLVLPSSYIVDERKVASALEAAEFRLASEEDFASTFPDCEVGAMPPFGNLYGVPVYVDGNLADEKSIVFPVGTYTETMSIQYADFARLEQPAVVEFARPRHIFSA